ncbi:MAG: peptidase G2 autoproteolytic cleavage domain-containing protein, partial [Bacillota bacterium]|nr:peptidase G2 autoproteolytic cleavage domain-containing protein [Bacillota bacterium]
DNNSQIIQDTLNNLPTSGSIITTSTTNGNIKIDGNEIVVYKHPTGTTPTNPHNTTASDVGLGNVTNESKTTMFTNPTFTGTVQEGHNTTSSGGSSHAEGYNTTSSGGSSHAEGYNTTSSGGSSHAEGYNTTSSGNASHAEGSFTTASGNYSHAEGNNTTANIYTSHVMGQYNKTLTGNATSFVSTADAFVIGNGTSSSALSNAFRVTFDGKTYGLSAFNSSGADYSEYFEWADENINKEDRVGYFVTYVDSETLKYISNEEWETLTDEEKQSRKQIMDRGQKIRKATSKDTDILGIISVTPSIIGDSCQNDWKNKYKTDEWGRIQYHEVTVEATYETIDGKQIEITPEHPEIHPIYNPNWNPSEEYIPREKRFEWTTVGMLGKLLVRDDGTCEINGYCKPNDEGMATKSDTGYRVIGRITNNIIKVLFK